MTKCFYCESETQLHVNAVPVCPKCLQEREAKPKTKPRDPQDIRAILLDNLVEATRRSQLANRDFEAVLGQFPSGLPQPDGAQRIKNASNQLSDARKEMARAHNRLNDYLANGITPEDLKWSD